MLLQGRLLREEPTMPHRRKIIRIDIEKCTGCGECIPNCPEGALQMIDGKARLVSDLFCDGLGACIGTCAFGAIAIEEREAEEYDERKVMANIVPHGQNTIRAHLKHLKEHGADDYYQEAVAYLKDSGIGIPAEESPHVPLPGGCPGSRVLDLSDGACADEPAAAGERRQSRLRQWPVQIMLVPPTAPYFKGADLVVAADCVPFAYPEFHEDFLKGKVLLVGCPKLDDSEYYEKKLSTILKQNDIKSVTVVHMEVPCCFGMVMLLESALKASGKDIPFSDVTIGVKGTVVGK